MNRRSHNSDVRPQLRLVGVAGDDAPQLASQPTVTSRASTPHVRQAYQPGRDVGRQVNRVVDDRHQAHVLAGPSDPRWVLATRVAEVLEGDVLPPDKRQRLMKLGALLGLRPFDVTLIIAVVQDQAREGHPPAACPKAGAKQLEMIPPPGRTTPSTGSPATHTFEVVGSSTTRHFAAMRNAGAVAALIAIEAWFVMWLLA